MTAGTLHPALVPASATELWLISWREGAETGCESRSFGVRHVHDVRGSAPGRSFSVHAYAPRLVTMPRHALTVQGPRPVGTTNEGAGW